MFTEEIEEMIKDSILRGHTTESEWDTPIFCTPKKDNWVHIVMELCKLNKCLVRKIQVFHHDQFRHVFSLL